MEDSSTKIRYKITALLRDVTNTSPNPAKGREFALVRTKLEEALMWAEKGNL